MDLEKIKTLRNKIAIPLDTAIKLLRKHNNDILACEKEFHNNNIKYIRTITECEEEIAKENYIFCNYDKAKAIERINSRQTIITTRKNKTSKNEIGFIIWPENANGENYKTVRRNDAFIPTADFDTIIEKFKSVFPLQNPWNKNIEESFDNCGHNFFDNKTCLEIVEKISNIETNDSILKQFLKEVIEWFNDKLKYADYIVIYGNL
ncbi:hypothetical protein LNQ49_21175 [Flavobacterium sp. F-65]|uniref:Uncharacterized protein n=1 Tax=Flavobacterium pisciphilum TaxID=2893755 RepID=A0ABS8MZA8_9FLAO|nr:hypothetical protein [Flavobacterium sp. F-65]MCC9074104.1 hypothetical protein [Flavobacterium sp. F-65]